VIAFALQFVNLDEVHEQHERFIEAHDKLLTDANERAGVAAEEFVRRYPGFKPRTGKVQRDTKHKVIRLGSGRLLRIENDNPVAAILDGGSRAHIIRAKNGKALRFVLGGRAIFRHSVNHPGTRPYKTFYRATFSAYRLLGQDLERGMAELASRF
jgi:hypothetical protein